MHKHLLAAGLAMVLAGCGHAGGTPTAAPALMAPSSSVSELPRIDALQVDGVAGHRFRVAADRPVVIRALESAGSSARRSWTINGIEQRVSGPAMRLERLPAAFTMVTYRVGSPDGMADSATVYLQAE